MEEAGRQEEKEIISHTRILCERDTSSSSTTQKLKRSGTYQPLTQAAQSKVRQTFFITRAYKQISKKQQRNSTFPLMNENVGYRLGNPPQQGLMAFIARAYRPS